MKKKRLYIHEIKITSYFFQLLHNKVIANIIFKSNTTNTNPLIINSTFILNSLNYTNNKGYHTKIKKVLTENNVFFTNRIYTSFVISKLFFS